MKIIMGLGNPGEKYRFSRHNAGFLALDILAERHDIAIKKSAFKALIGEGHIHGEKILLVKPQTFMNLSGESALAVVSYYKIDMRDFIVTYDDIDLPLGEIRVRAKGSAGTHNGMRSIIYELGTDMFARVRVGIGKAKEGWDLANFVIAPFDKAEHEPAFGALSRAADAIETILREGVGEAQSAYNKNAAKSNAAAKADAEGDEN